MNQFDPLLNACPICKSDSIRYSKTDWRKVDIFLCEKCKTQFMNPQYSDEYLQKFYREYQSTDFKHHEFGESEMPREIIHDYNISHIESFVSKGRFLSVGCGNAIDIKIAHRRGWDAEGFEVDDEFVRKLRETLPLKIFSGDFISLPLMQNYYNCVYLNHVLEHPKNPGAYFEKISAILKPGGVLYIACPNIDSIANRFKNLVDKLGLKKKVANHYDTWQHLFYYSPRNLKKALETYYPFEAPFFSNDLSIAPSLDKLKNIPQKGTATKSTFRLIAVKKLES